MQLRFEASVCAAIPVVKVLRESMIASDVDGVLGIVNGTTNYILTAMDQGQDYASALARAQELGYAEADPTEDVNGADAAAKIAILASIAFHTRVTIDDVPHSRASTRWSRSTSRTPPELGYRIKLIAEAARARTAASSPACTPRSCPRRTRWPAVDGAFNAVMLRGQAIREITLVGPGAGGAETASAVVGDLMGILGTSGTGFFQHDGYYRRLPIVPPAEVESALFLRLDVLDRARRAGADRGLAGRPGRSRSTPCIQRATDGRADLVILTHPAPEGRFFSAVHGIQALGVVAGDPHVLRVILPTHLGVLAMLFMVIETFRNGDALSAYRRFRDDGRGAPDGVEYVGSWIEASLNRCFQLMETDDVGLLQQWVAFWADLVEFEIVPVATSKEVYAALESKL